MPFKDPIKKKQYQKEWGKKNNKKVWERRKNDSAYKIYAKLYMKEYNKRTTNLPEKDLQLLVGRLKKGIWNLQFL